MSNMESEKIESVFNSLCIREDDEKLLQPYLHILQVPGKSKYIQAKVARTFNYWLKIPEDKLIIIDEIVQMLYNAGILLDDIQDNSIKRGGNPVAHLIFGIAGTMNTAFYVVFICLEKAMSLNHPEATNVCIEQILELHHGQGMEIYWRDNFICPSEDEYKIMTIEKTGGFFMLMIRLMQLFSDNKSNFKEFIELFSYYFQIINDYCSLRSAEFTSDKTFCEDLTEGKFGFPIIHGIQSHPEDHQIIDILRQRTSDIEIKRYCVELLEKYGSFQYTRNVLQDIDKELRAKVAELGDNPLMISWLDKLRSWDTMEENN